jgi:hypothetical protein
MNIIDGFFFLADSNNSFINDILCSFVLLTILSKDKEKTLLLSFISFNTAFAK